MSPSDLLQTHTEGNKAPRGVFTVTKKNIKAKSKAQKQY